MASTGSGQHYAIKNFSHSAKLNPQSSSAVHYLAISPPRIHITDELGITSPGRDRMARSFDEGDADVGVEEAVREEQSVEAEGREKAATQAEVTAAVEGGEEEAEEEGGGQRTKSPSSGANERGEEGEAEEEGEGGSRKMSLQDASPSSPLNATSPQVSPADQQHHHQPHRPYTLLGSRTSQRTLEEALSRTTAATGASGTAASSPNSISSSRVAPSSSSTSSGGSAFTRSTSSSGSSWSRRQSSTDQTTFSSRSVWSSKRSR